MSMVFRVGTEDATGAAPPPYSGAVGSATGSE